MTFIKIQEAARKIACAIISDISLDNEEKIASGISNDNLFEVIYEEIEQGRLLYNDRISSLVPVTLPELKNFYDLAIVDIIIKARSHIKSKMW